MWVSPSQLALDQFQNVISTYKHILVQIETVLRSVTSTRLTGYAPRRIFVMMRRAYFQYGRLDIRK